MSLLSETLTFPNLGFEYDGIDNVYILCTNTFVYHIGVLEGRTATLQIQIQSINDEFNYAQTYINIAATEDVGSFIESYLTLDIASKENWIELTGHFTSLYRNDVIDNLLLDI